MSIKTVLSVTGSILVTVFLGGYVVATLWKWFVVPTFAAPALGIVPAIGISLIARLLTFDAGQYTDSEHEKVRPIEAFAYHIYMGIGVSVACLVIGWILHLFM